MSDLDPMKEKVAIIAKELDTGFLVFNRSATQLFTMQGWTLTVVLAYLAFMASIKADNALILLPLLIVLLLFMYMEAFHRRDMHWTAKEICAVESIFMEADPARFTEIVKEYKFRDIRLHTEKEKQPWPFKYLVNVRVIVWYLLLFVLIYICYVGISSQVILANVSKF